MKIIDTAKTKLLSFAVVAIASVAATSLATTLLMKADVAPILQVFFYVGIVSYYIALSVGLVNIKTEKQPEQLELAF